MKRTGTITDIADTELHVVHMRREGLAICDFDQAHFDRNFVRLVDRSPIATVGGPLCEGAKDYGAQAWADLFTAAPAMLRALELWKASDEEVNEGARQVARQIAREYRDEAIEAARASQRRGERTRGAA